MHFAAEALVVGGGITGASLLHHLHAAGVDAVLLERGRLASGATGRNAGFLIAGVAENYEAAIARYGRELAFELWQFTRACHLELAAALEGADVEYRRSGSLTAAASEAEAGELQRSGELLRADGLEAEWQDHVAELPSAYRGGLLNPGDAELDSAAAVRELVALAGGRAKEGAEVVAIEPATGRVEVRTRETTYRAQRVFIATNAWASQLLPGLAIAPIRGQVLLTEPLPARVVERPVYADRGFQYWRQRRDRSLLVGGWRNTDLAAEVGYETEPTPAVQARLEAHLVALGVSAAISRRWAGTMAFTPDHLPLVGPVAGMPGVFVAAGYSGHGMGFAFRAARLLVGSLTGEAPVPGWLDPRRLHPAPH